MSDPCLHGMPTPASCIDCMDEGNLARLADDRPVPTGATITARYDGDCRVCPSPIIAGLSLIRRLSDESGWVHSGCTP